MLPKAVKTARKTSFCLWRLCVDLLSISSIVLCPSLEATRYNPASSPHRFSLLSAPALHSFSQPCRLRFSTFFNMLLKTFVLAVVAIIAATVQADCAAGKILGKFAICGSDPVDCGSGLCCQQGATCVSDDTAGFRCSMPLASIGYFCLLSNALSHY